MIRNHVRKDLQRLRRRPLEFLIWLGIPLMVGALFTLLFGGSDGPKPVAHLLVVDEDQSFVSRLILRALDGGGGEANAMPLRAESVAAAEGRRRIDAGEATALLTLPAGFGDAILTETPLTLSLVTNPSQTLLPRIVIEGLEILADGHFYLHRLVGEDLKRFAAMETSPSDADIADFSVRVRALFERLSESLDPPLIALVDEPAPADAEPAESVPMSFLFLPSVLFMALLFMAQALSGEIWEEAQARTLPRILCAPGGPLGFLLGKLGAALALFLAVGALSLLIGALALGLAPPRLPAALLWIGLSGTAIAAFFTALQLLARSQRAANILTMTLIFPLMMLGGSFFPFEIMPAWMAHIGGLTPNGWSLLHLKRILLGRESAPALLAGVLALVAATALLTALNAARLRARFGRA